MSHGAINPGPESRAGEGGAGVARTGDQHGGSGCRLVARFWSVAASSLSLSRRGSGGTEIVKLLEEPGLIQSELDRRLEAARHTDPTKRREDGLRRDLVRLQKSLARLLTAYQEDLLRSMSCATACAAPVRGCVWVTLKT